MGPPADYPVMIRVSGYDVDKVKNIADEVAMKMRQDSNIYNVNFDWQEKAKTLHLELDQDKLRAMGISIKWLPRPYIQNLQEQQLLNFIKVIGPLI